jgi:hypothetical protein
MRTCAITQLLLQQQKSTTTESRLINSTTTTTIMMASIAENDVLSGRGGATNNHPGNRSFRSIVTDHMPEYLAARKKEKAVIARCIVNQIKADGGRFLKRASNSDDAWVELSDKKAADKTSQALREGLDVRHKTYRPEKMARRDSDSSHENPRKKTRLVMGIVVDSPKRQAFSGTGAISSPGMPELKQEEDSDYSSSNSQPYEDDPLMKYFDPPRISKADCEDVAAV